MSEEKVVGAESFTTKDVTPFSVIYRYKDKKATLIYEHFSKEGKQVISRPFDQYFSNLNTKVLDLQNDIILPNGCIYRALLDNGEEAFLIQDLPGIRTFRLSNKNNITNLVSKMYNRFIAQTRTLEKNEPEPGKEAEVKKQIALRNQYISKQKLQPGIEDGFYKLQFRAYFPYTYLAIVINRKRNNSNSLSFSRMAATISLVPVNTMNDYLYQFPLSNVSSNGSVCTGQLPLGEFGYVNIKSYVEKMSGYFWNNRFNADITAGPETYGNRNFLGNWFEWEYMSYIDPASVLSLDFTDEAITKHRRSVGDFIYSGGSHAKHSKSLNTIDEFSIINSFETNQTVGDSYVDLEHGTAKKNIASIAETIDVEGYQIPVGTIIINEKDKKFKITSYDGFKTYDVSDSTLQEDESVVTHVNLRDEQKRTYRLSLEKGLNFILRAYRKAKNFVEEAVFGDQTYSIGQLVCVDTDYGFKDAYHDLDMIKSIRERDGNFIFEFYKREYFIASENGEAPKALKPVSIVFGSQDKVIESGAKFTFRTKKLLDGSHKPAPYTIRDHLSDIQTGEASIVRYSYGKKTHRSYHYSNSTRNVFSVHTNFKKADLDPESSSVELDKCEFTNSDDMVTFYVPLPKYISLAEEEFEEITPSIEGSEPVIVGREAFEAISGYDRPNNVPFKIMRDSDGTASISTVGEGREAVENMFFHMSIDHLKRTITEVDGVKAFKIRDLFEVGSDREYITFKVGDEVMLASDWNPMLPSSDQAPSIKKIYDFITVEDLFDHELETAHQDVDDHLISGMVEEHADVIRKRYRQYAKVIGHNPKKKIDRHKGIKAKRGVLYAVIDDGSENLKIHPMIDSYGQHFLNGITHAKRQVGDLKVGDFIKANVARIPYFAKKDVDQINAFIEINGRDLAILNNGATMWCDIIESHFKVFHRDKLTDAKIEFYIAKVREPNMEDHMVMYGDLYVGKIGIPLFTPWEAKALEEDFGSEKMRYIYQDIIEDAPKTTRMMKKDLEELVELNGSTDFKAFIGFRSNNVMNVKYDLSRSAFRCQYHKVLGAVTSTSHIAKIGINHKSYDISYALHNRSLTNGAAYMPMRECFHDPMIGYRYYSAPFRTDESWCKMRNIEITMLTFPTPRVLKNMTRKKSTYKVFKQMGPQNRFYNQLQESEITYSSGRYSIKNDEPTYNIVSDAIFPTIEED